MRARRGGPMAGVGAVEEGGEEADEHVVAEYVGAEDLA